jgi:hypothetical protein
LILVFGLIYNNVVGGEKALAQSQHHHSLLLLGGKGSIEQLHTPKVFEHIYYVCYLKLLYNSAIINY